MDSGSSSARTAIPACLYEGDSQVRPSKLAFANRRADVGRRSGRCDRGSGTRVRGKVEANPQANGCRGPRGTPSGPQGLEGRYKLYSVTSQTASDRRRLAVNFGAPADQFNRLTAKDR